MKRFAHRTGKWPPQQPNSSEASPEHVARALADALDADDTAITEAALDSLLARDEPYGADLIWNALTTLDDDLTMHIWGFLYPYPNHPITLELKRCKDAAS